MIETANITGDQLGQIQIGMRMTTAVKRGRGRPRLDDPADRKGLLRGAKQGTIDRFKRICAEQKVNEAKKFEEVLSAACDEMESIEAREQRLTNAISEYYRQGLRLSEECLKLEALKAEQGSMPADRVSYGEALERVIERLCARDLRGDYLGMLEPNAKKLAQDYRHMRLHWQNIKRELQQGIEERLGVKKREPDRNSSHGPVFAERPSGAGNETFEVTG